MNIQVLNNNNEFNYFDDNLNTTFLINENVTEQIQDEVNTIMSMGFDPKMAKKIYVLFKPKDINEAIYLLTEENGKYHHYFIERHGKEDECFICGKPQENHYNFRTQNNSTRKSRLNSTKDNKTNKQINAELSNISYNQPLIEDDEVENAEPEDDIINENIYCGVCDNDLTNNEKKKNKIPCGHYFCSDCYLNYLKDKIINNKIGKITCMQEKCPTELDEKFIKSHLNNDNELFEKYKIFKNRNDIYNNPNLVLCPKCESYAKKQENNKLVTCLEGHKFCSECKGPWHNGKCQLENIDEYQSDHLLKRCPRCKMMTEKAMGCNHMTCPKCGFQWCWFCEKEYKKGHYGVNGPCARLQFTQSELYNNCCFLYLYRFSVFLYHCILLILSIPATTIVYYYRNGEDKYNFSKKTQIISYIFAVFISIANLGIFIGCGCIFFIFCIFARKIKKKTIVYLLDIHDREED